MAIDPFSHRPQYRQLADALRDQIRSGRLRPDDRLPVEPTLCRQYRVGRETVRQALAVLRGEGLVETSRGIGTVVCPPPERRPLALEAGAQVIARMPMEPECVQLAVREGVPVFEIEWPDGRTEIRSADRVRLVVVPELLG